MDIKTIGVDLGKTWFHVVGCNRAGKPVVRQKLNRSHLLQFVANLPVCLIVLAPTRSDSYSVRRLCLSAQVTLSTFPDRFSCRLRTSPLACAHSILCPDVCAHDCTC